MTPVLCRASAPTMTFSSADMFSKSRMFWNVRATPCAVTRCGLRPEIRLPANRISPSVGW